MTESLAIAPSIGIASRGQRQDQLADYILHNSSARIQELAERFGVSPMTIHRDLDELEAQKIVRKVRGGVTAQPSSLFESDVRYRLVTATREKEALAQLALSYVEPGQAVMMDDSTTVLTLARRLQEVAPLTVITNGAAIIKELSGAKGVRLISLGGEYNPHFDAFTGLLCEQAISALRANVLFMSTPAVSSGSAFHQEQEIVKVKRAMLGAATLRILLIDHGKLGKVALHRLASLQDFDVVLVDSGVDQAQLRLLRDAQVRVEVAPELHAVAAGHAEI